MTTSADRTEQQLSYVLHSRPYRETSALVDYFSQDHGRIRAVVKGVRGKRSKQRPLTQPFVPLEISWRGQQELKTVVLGEQSGTAVLLQQRALWCGLYLNELTLRLLPPADPQPKLFAYYQLALQRLHDQDQQEAVLRVYERQLLQLLGLAVDYRCCIAGRAIEAEAHYQFDPQQGFIRCGDGYEDTAARSGFQGAAILALADDDFRQPEHRRQAKRMMRMALAPYLGSKPLRSRELFQFRPLQADNSGISG